MDKKDLYMTLSELLGNYTRADIDDALDGIIKLYQAEYAMGRIKINNIGVKNATRKKTN